MRILQVSAELFPLLKTGGLADVAGALPLALAAAGEDVRVLLPGFPALRAGVRHAAQVAEFRAPWGETARLVYGHIELNARQRIGTYLIDAPALYDRPGNPYEDANRQPYGDNHRRFALLGWAAAQLAQGLDGHWHPEVVHAHDWHAALAPAYLAHAPGGARARSVFTIHNLAYQGLFPHAVAPLLGIPDAAREDLEFYGQMSFLRGGIVHAAHVNTVSVSYAAQITLPAMGCGLDRLLARRAAAGGLTGILNGIDASWDPSTDNHLQAHFNLHDWAGRQANARQVRREFGLPERDGPLFAVVSRLVHQKGLDLICEVAPQIVAAGGQIVVIGGGEPQIEQSVLALTRRYPGHVGAFIGFEEQLARRMFAGSDFLLMPSRFEPCGLSQMYAQRFGSLPIAHATGGLIDTVDDGVTGFLFQEPSADALRRCLARAFRTFRLPGLIQAMRRAAMLKPSGWDVAGSKYLALYDRTAALA